MRRRRFVALGAAGAATFGTARAADWVAPQRFVKPDLATDEGGLWALMDREETRVRRSPLVMKTHGLADYLQALACKLAGEHCADMRVYPVRTPWFNASMAPNGMMQVWSGLLLRVDNEAQLAAVLGHEVAHYLQRHSLERLRDVRSRSAANLAFALLGGAGLIAQLANLAGMAQYSREHERQADRVGLLLLHRAGYDAREASKVWSQLRAELSAGAGGDPTKKSVLFASHPPSDARERDLAAEAQALPAGGVIGAEALDAAIAPFLPELLDDELKRGQYDETVVLLDRLIARRPGQAQLLYARGEARRLRGRDDDLDPALADFQAAAELPDAPPQAQRSMGFMARKRGDAQAAREAFQRYLALAPQAGDAALINTYVNDLTSKTP